MHMCLIRNATSSIRTSCPDVVWQTWTAPGFGRRCFRRRSDSLLSEERMRCDWRWIVLDDVTSQHGSIVWTQSVLCDPVPAGLFLLLPIHMAKTPASMCMPLRTLNDSLSHRRRYMVRETEKVSTELQLAFFFFLLAFLNSETTDASIQQSMFSMTQYKTALKWICAMF